MVIAERYRLVRCIGRGGFAEVWEAHDGIDRREVAVKLLSERNGNSLPRIRREQLLLRQLRMPGVVHFLGEGTHEGAPFLVMERVRGKPFPGGRRKRRAEFIVDIAARLAETLDRVHAQGVIHRDLKPANILVDDAGHVTLLDFGIALDARGAGPHTPERGGPRRGALTEAGKVMGTPAYLAPEQLREEPITARTDLYAFGLVLHEALLGGLPHVRSNGKLDRSARMSSVRVELPRRFREAKATRALAGLLDLLLRGSPESRPESARQVVEMLRGHEALAARDELPWLGSRDAIHRVVSAAAAGRSVDVVGPRGSGRKRCLQEAARCLEQKGIPVLLTRPPRAYPFSSLEPVIGSLDPGPDKTLAEVEEAAAALLRAKLAEGCVVIAAGDIDRWSAAVLDDLRGAGALLRARIGRSGAPFGDPAGTVRLALLSEKDLMPLFHGPQRLWHLQEDAAALLHARTAGLPAQVIVELDSWVDAGFAQKEHGMYSVRREALAEAALGIRGTASAQDRVAVDLAPHLVDLLEHAAVLGPRATPARLAQLTRQARWQVDAWIEELLDLGVVRSWKDGRVEPTGATRSRSSWSPEKRCLVHLGAAAALAAGDPERLGHLVSGRAPPLDVAEEAGLAARRLAEEGHLGHAVIAIETGLLALRSIDGRSPAAGRLEEELLRLRVLVSFAEFGSGAHARARYELSRAVRRAPGILALERLMNAAVALHEQSRDALAMVEAIAPFEDVELERCRRYALVLAARYHPIGVERDVLRRVAPDDPLRAPGPEAALEDPVSRARACAWRGRLAYREGDYAAAARLHAEATRAEPWATARISARLNSASALLEGAKYEEAAEAAAEALQELRTVRQPYLAARAEWIFRTALFRRGAATAPDDELVLAAESLDVPEQQAAIVFTEAAIAYHLGRRERAAAWGERARALFGARNPSAALMAECLAGAARQSAPSPEDEQHISSVAADCPAPEIGLQSLALVAHAISRDPACAGRAPAAATVAAARALLPRVGPQPEHARWDVLSLEECLSALELS